MAASELWESVEEPDSVDPSNEPGPSGDRDADIDTVRLYFHQIGRVPLLKPHEEYALCQRIEAARSAVAAALLAVPEGASRIAQVSALKGGAHDVASLLLSPEGRALHKAEIADAMNHLAQAIREGAALMRVDQALDRSEKAGRAPRSELVRRRERLLREVEGAVAGVPLHPALVEAVAAEVLSHRRGRPMPAAPAGAARRSARAEETSGPSQSSPRRVCGQAISAIRTFRCSISCRKAISA